MKCHLCGSETDSLSDARAYTRRGCFRRDLIGEGEAFPLACRDCRDKGQRRERVVLLLAAGLALLAGCILFFLG